ncbi:MAG TPA: Yip1 family protein [Thermoclostridium sp.]
MYNNTENYQLGEELVPEKMNIFQRIGNLIFNPKKLFSYTARKPTILFPVVILCILSLVTQLLLMEQYQGTYTDLFYNATKTAGGEISVDQAENMAKWFAIGTVASTPVILVITWLITTLILYLVFRLAGCEKGLKKYFSMVAYISIISVLGQLLHSIYVYFTGESILTAQVTSLASLISSETVGSFLYGIAKNIEVFNIWTYILYGVGFVYTGGAKKQRAYIITAVLFVIVTLVTAGSSNLSSQLAAMQY